MEEVKDTDHQIVFAENNNVFNWYEKKQTVEKYGKKYAHAVRLNVVTELTKDASVHKVILMAKNYEGVKEINRIVSHSFRGRNKTGPEYNFYYVPRTPISELEKLSDNIYVIFGTLNNPIWKNKRANLDESLDMWLDFIKGSENSFLAITSDESPESEFMNNYFIEADFFDKTRLLLVDDTMSHSRKFEYMRFLLNKMMKDDYEATQQSLHLRTIDEVLMPLRGGANKEIVQMAIDNTVRLVDNVEEFEMDKSFKYPKLFDNPDAKIQSLVKEGYAKRGVHKLPEAKQKEYQARVIHELNTMRTTKSIDYLLLENYTKTNLAKQGVYPSFGRGSVAGSLVAYLLDITDVDPIKEDLLFERFMNKDRISLADIDSDWSPKGQKAVQRFLLEDEKLSAASVITYGTLGVKGAIKGVGRALDYDYSELNLLSLSINDKVSPYTTTPENREKYSLLLEYVDSLLGTITHNSRHAGAILVSDRDVLGEIGTAEVSDTDFPYPVTSWGMSLIEGNNYVKLDVLGLKNVAWVQDTAKLVGEIDIDSQSKQVDYNDWAVRDDILKYGVSTLFQIENQEEAVLKMFSNETISKIKHRNPDITMIDVLSILLSVIRPGSASIMEDVVSGNQHVYDIPEIDELLKDSYGHIIYQEQTMALIQYAGFTASEADSIRRAIGHKQPEVINKWIPSFIDTLVNKIHNEYPDRDKDEVEETVSGLAQIIIDSSDYAFNKAHAKAYAYLTMLTAWFRTYHPVEWLTAGYTVWSDRHDKVSMLNRLSYAKGIKLDRMKFRKSKSYHFFDDNNTIFEGVLQVSGMNEKVGDFLHEYTVDKEYDTFTDFLMDVTDPFVVERDGEPIENHLTLAKLPVDDVKAIDKDIKAGKLDVKAPDEIFTPNSRQVLALIRLDYFSEFGGSKKLENIYENYRKKYNKTNKTLASKHKNLNAVLEYEKGLDNDEHTLYDKANYELDYLKKCTIVDERIPAKYAVVSEIIKETKTYVMARIHSINKGISTDVKISRRLYANVPIKVGDIVSIESSKSQYKNANIEGQWIKTKDKELWITNMTYVRKRK